MTQLQQPSDAAIRDTLDAVFASEAFSSVARETIWTRLTHWVFEFFRDLGRLTGGSRLLYYMVLIAAIGLVVAIVARIAYVARARGYFRRGAGGVFGGGGATRSDPWSLAQRLAAEGDYTGAAHALYSAILLNVSQSGLVRLHDAKTIGDYLREMRARIVRPASTFPRFCAFVRVRGVRRRRVRSAALRAALRPRHEDRGSWLKRRPGRDSRSALRASCSRPGSCWGCWSS